MTKLYVSKSIKCPSEFYEKYKDDDNEYIEISYILEVIPHHSMSDSPFGSIALKIPDKAHQQIDELRFANKYLFFKLEYSKGVCRHFYGYDIKVNPWCHLDNIEITIELGGRVIRD